MIPVFRKNEERMLAACLKYGAAPYPNSIINAHESGG